MRDILENLVVPSGWASALFALGLAAALWPRTRRWSWGLLAASCSIVLIFSSGVTAAALMSPLEYRYPAIDTTGNAPDARQIVILTGYAADDKELPVTGKLNFSSAFRVMLAVQLYRDRPDAQVIVSGPATTSRLTAEALAALGVPRAQIRTEELSESTAQSAVQLRSLVSGRFFLVTSAGHMPRSVALMTELGLDPIPAPTDYQMPRDWRRAELRPSPESWVVSNLAVHEYIGQLWYRLQSDSRTTP